MHMHMPVLGFRVGGFTYITDAKTIAREQLDKIRGSEVLVLNALRHEEHYSHLNIKEALAIVQEVRPKQAYFTHISHLMGLHAEAQSYLPPNVRIAHDGLVVELQEP